MQLVAIAFTKYDMKLKVLQLEFGHGIKITMFNSYMKSEEKGCMHEPMDYVR